VLARVFGPLVAGLSGAGQNEGMESLLETFLVGGAAAGIFALILYGVRALFGDESGSHDSNGPDSTDQDGRNSASDTTDRNREESCYCKHCGHEMPTYALACRNCDAPKKPEDFLRWQHDKRRVISTRGNAGQRSLPRVRQKVMLPRSLKSVFSWIPIAL